MAASRFVRMDKRRKAKARRLVQAAWTSSDCQAVGRALFDSVMMRSSPHASP